jgi:nitrite reductase/ring-hydroxylating ferredoxin subunit
MSSIRDGLSFVTVGSPADVPEGEMVAFDVGGHRIAVAHLDGEFFAFDDACTHAQCSLSEGDLEGSTFGSLLEAEGMEPTPGSVVCPCHFGMFDLRTGAVLGGVPTEPVRTYQIDVQDGELQIGL